MRCWNHTILEALKLSVPPVLIRIMSRAGSAPRTAGARMLLDGDGALAGTIGGGSYEAQAMDAAKNMQTAWRNDHGAGGQSRQGNARILDFSLSGVSDMDMVCGGELRVLLELLSETRDVHRVFSLAAQAEEKGQAYTLVTRLSPAGAEYGPPALRRYCTTRSIIRPEEHGAEHQNLPQDIVKKACALAGKIPLEMQGPDADYLLEPFPAPHLLHLFGGGHVAKALAELTHTLGFRVVVLEDRPEFITPQRFPHARRQRLASLGREETTAYLAKEPITERHGIIIMTRGHAHDREVLAAGLLTRAGYIGMIGSRSKWGQVQAALLKSGASQASLARVHTPIGLAIGADTPEEIAVSIAAELVAWRSGLFL